MATFKLTCRAEEDLLEIAAYTRGKWGEAQCLEYLDALEACCRRLAEVPGLGRACEEVRPGCFRMEQGRHVVFYRHTGDGVLIVRILHERMLPELHLSEDDEPEGSESKDGE